MAAQRPVIPDSISGTILRNLVAVSCRCTSRRYTLANSTSVDVEASEQVSGAVRPHDIAYQDQPVGDWSTGSVESMEWQQHLQVNEEEMVGSSKQSAKSTRRSSIFIVGAIRQRSTQASNPRSRWRSRIPAAVTDCSTIFFAGFAGIAGITCFLQKSRIGSIRSSR